MQERSLEEWDDEFDRIDNEFEKLTGIDVHLIKTVRGPYFNHVRISCLWSSASYYQQLDIIKLIVDQYGELHDSDLVLEIVSKVTYKRNSKIQELYELSTDANPSDQKAVEILNTTKIVDYDDDYIIFYILIYQEKYAHAHEDFINIIKKFDIVYLLKNVPWFNAYFYSCENYFSSCSFSDEFAIEFLHFRLENEPNLDISHIISGTFLRHHEGGEKYNKEVKRLKLFKS